MDTSASHVLAGVVEGLLQVGTSLGLDRVELLALAMLDEATLLDRDAAIPLRCQVAIGRAIVDARPGVNVGLELLRRLRPGLFGVLGYSLAHCESLGESLETFVRYQAFVTDALEWTRPDSMTLKIEAAPGLAPLGHPVEAAVGLWVILGRELADVDWVPRALEFRHQSLGDPAEHEALFGVRPRFAADRNALVLDEATLALPIRGAELDLRASLLRLLDSRLGPINEPEIVSSVRTELRRSLPRGAADKSRVARALGMSSRTLARRLQEVGTRYDAVLDETRQALASELLEDRSLAIYEVAFLLGYNEPSTFHRAFRRWTHDTPDAWRRARFRASSRTTE